MANLRYGQGNCRPRRAGRMARTGMMLRLLRRIVSAEFMGLVLVLVALQALTYGISSSLRSTDTRYFFWVCLVAALLAFGLSKRNVNGAYATVAMIVIVIIGVWILGARL